MFLSQKWLRSTRMPPARVLRAKLGELRRKPVTVSAARKQRLSLTIIASTFSSFIAISVVPPYFFTSHYIDISEAGHDPEKKEDEEEPWVSAKPFIELEADEDADSNSYNNRYPDGRERPQGAEQTPLFLTYGHKDLSMLQVGKEQNLNFIT
jgi:hypothetical protein